MKRIARGVGALLGLLLGLIGVPLALVLLGSDMWPDSWGPAQIVRALLQPDDGRLLVGLITLVAWVAWLVFALSVVTELIGLISHRRRRLRIPGLAAPQRLAAALLVAVIALVPIAPTAHADPVAPTASPEPPAAGQDPPVRNDQPALSNRPPAATPPAADPAAAVGTRSRASTHDERAEPKESATVHRVTDGDDLWSLAERYYGNGLDWRKIAKANSHLLTGGPDRLEPGWKLTIPDVAPASDDAPTVTAHRGDTLSSIADRELDSASRWPELFRANRAVLDDPDELAVGTSLVIPRNRAAQPEADKRDHGAPDRAKGPQRDADRTGTDSTGSAGPSSDQPATTGASQEPAPTPSSAKTAAGSPTAASGAPTEAASHPTQAGPQPTAGVSQPTARASQRSEASEETAGATSQPTTATPQTTAPATESQPVSTIEAAPIGIFAGVGGLLAAGLIGGLAYRRRLQLQARPVGRRILQAPPETARAETELGAAQRPLDLETVDFAFRALAVHCRRSGEPVPALTMAILDADSLVLRLDRAPRETPLGFRVHPDGWSVDRIGARYLASLPGLADAMRPYPALVELGHDPSGRRVLVNLEELGLLSLPGDADRATELLAAMSTELAFVPAADEMILTLVGDRSGLPEALDKHNVTTTDDIDGLLDRLEARARDQREQRPDGPAGHYRIDPDLSDPWAPEVIMINDPLGPDQQRRFVALVSTEPRPTIAVVALGEIADAPWTLRLGAEHATLEPAGLELTAQRLRRTAEAAVVSLVATTGSLETTPAPWWAVDHEPPDPPPDNVAYLARRSAGWGTDHDDENGQDMAQNPGIGRDAPPDHPVLLLLGPIDLVGAQGPLPPRAAKQCLEYCGWLLEHPGTTAQAMGAALLVAEGTRRSNMSRLRAWLGADPDGEPYLPDAYSGRIMLQAAVSSDWHRLQILTAGGVNRTSDIGLRSALELVRGAPLADAAPGQWHWAEELRIDMISAVRDIGVELAGRANDAGELDLSRWAAARALAAAPGDELLMAARIRTEHLAGNRAETERLTLQLATHSRTLGVDLDPETVDLLQKVMEGQVRARLA